mmetsp:Transcript_67555/g.119833  ORF Transcript_67555/g.119833 Transcript_67555/m.119833 type:complete len:103 (-) Transcript_67555:476-784(-)
MSPTYLIPSFPHEVLLKCTANGDPCLWHELLKSPPMKQASGSTDLASIVILRSTSILSPWVDPGLRCTDPMTHIPPMVGSNATNKQDSSSNSTHASPSGEIR